MSFARRCTAQSAFRKCQDCVRSALKKCDEPTILKSLFLLERFGCISLDDVEEVDSSRANNKAQNGLFIRYVKPKQVHYCWTINQASSNMHTSCRTQLNLHRISRGNICSDTDGDVIANVGNILKIEGKIVAKQYSHSSSDQERIEQTEQRERETREGTQNRRRKENWERNKERSRRSQKVWRGQNFKIFSYTQVDATFVQMRLSIGRFGFCVIFLLGIVLPVSAPARVPRQLKSSL